MTPEELKEALRDIDVTDVEAAHSQSDLLLVKTLRSLGYYEAMDVYELMEKWYS